MSKDLYADVDRYLEGLFGEEDPVLQGALDRATGAGMPAINVSAAHGRLLHVLALTRGARTILEIGTLAGYSAIWLGRALPPGGRLVSLELDPAHAEIARVNLAAAGLDDCVEVRVGRALDLLAEMADEGAGPFDMVFIDADKPPYADYLEASLKLVRTGSLIVADNVIRRGAVADDSDSDDEAVAGVRRFNAALAADPRVTASFVQQVGVKGHDGMAVAVVTNTD